MIAQHMDYFMSSHFSLYHFIGFVSLYFVVGKILVFLYTSLMLCENKIRSQFPLTGINKYTFVLPSLKALEKVPVSI